MKNPGQFIAKAGAAGITLAIAGATAEAASVATIVAATGGAAALVLVGAGIYYAITSRNNGS